MDSNRSKTHRPPASSSRNQQQHSQHSHHSSIDSTTNDIHNRAGTHRRRRSSDYAKDEYNDRGQYEMSSYQPQQPISDPYMLNPPIQSAPHSHHSSRNNSSSNLFVPDRDPRYMTGGSVQSAHSAQSTNSQPVQRKHTMQRIQLFRGNLVLNCPVPDKLLSNVPYNDTEEVAALRYTAATCDPNDFIHSNYTLRPALYGRQTELLITMTMYNEDENLFIRTMSAVEKSIAYLCARNRSQVWGQDGWKKIVVCIVADGRHKIHPRVLQILGIMGAFQEGIMKSEVNGKPVQAHIFEYTTQITVDSNMKVKGNEVPVQLIFCLKENNKKKLNSHRWALNAFAPILRPNICVLLDVGTKPTAPSIYYLWKEFDVNPSLGGACGEIAVDTGRAKLKLFNPLVAAQNFEYKLSNILDKPLESVFGFISVLPGAFSAYRYAALINTAPGVGPLASYFEGEKLHEGSANIYKANMYLAEDRVLCFEVVAKPKADWVLKYVYSAKAYTDVPEGIAEFISQRRRWLNGAFFAMIYALSHWHRIWRTGHSFGQKLWFQVQLVYNIINTLFTWFCLALFYLTFFFMAQIVTDDKDPNNPLKKYGDVVFDLARYFYIFAIIIIFIVSLGNRPQGSRGIYITTFLLFAIIMVMIMFLSGYGVYTAISSGAFTSTQSGEQFFQNSAFRDLIIALGAQFGVYIISSILYLDPWHMITSFVQYLFLLPSFINVLTTYAFCNTHDVSWGTKGDNKPTKLGSVKTTKGQNDTVEVELPFTDHKDKVYLNSEYDRWLMTIADKQGESPRTIDLATQLEDWYRAFRTRFVLTWLFSNAITVLVFSHPFIVEKLGGSKGGNVFLAILFYSYLAMSFIRFIGSTIYLFSHWKDHYASCRCC